MDNSQPETGKTQPRRRPSRRTARVGRVSSPTAVAGLGLVALASAALGLQVLPAEGSPVAGAANPAPTTRALGNDVRTLTYHGITITVPTAWPVYRLGANSRQCVRFDRHAVYLGTPGPDENCPAHLLGQAGAVLVEPLTPSAVLQAMSRLTPAQVDGRNVGVSRQNAVQPGYTLVSPQSHAELVVTSGPRAAVAGAITASVRIGSAPAGLTPASEAGPTAVPARVGAVENAPGADSTAKAAAPGPSVYTGHAFDVCATPSSATMSAWASSPYRGIGVYLGGDEAACAQPNLTAAWTAQVAAAGWHLIPIYVGPQAACADASFAHVIGPRTAAQQGRQSAEAAVSLASAVGLGTHNPIFYDMESWNNTDSSCNAAVLTYLASWTTELHALGYESGVYSSAATGITALVDVSGRRGYTEPDELWIGDWNGEATTSDSYVPAGKWSHNQRIHQYRGSFNASYGGVSLNIDADYCDALLADAGAGPVPLPPSGVFATIGNTAGDATLASGDRLSPGTSIITASGQYRLTMRQSDGDLVLSTAAGRSVWSAGTAGHRGAYAVMRNDGDFVIYSSAGAALWRRGTTGYLGAELALQADANLLIYSEQGKALWSTDTTNPELTNGEQLYGSWYLESSNRAYKLVEQKADGNLVLYDSAHSPLWSSRTGGHAGARAVLQRDGNLVIYSATGRALWSIGRAHHAGDRLVLQVDGNLVLYAASGAVLWDTRT